MSLDKVSVIIDTVWSHLLVTQIRLGVFVTLSYIKVMRLSTTLSCLTLYTQCLICLSFFFLTRTSSF